MKSTVDNIVITVYGDRSLTRHHDHFLMYANIKSLCRIPESNIMLHTHSILIKIIKLTINWRRKKKVCLILVQFLI